VCVSELFKLADTHLTMLHPPPSRANSKCQTKRVFLTSSAAQCQQHGQQHEP
jgi:hypothetical protein